MSFLRNILCLFIIFLSLSTGVASHPKRPPSVSVEVIHLLEDVASLEKRVGKLQLQMEGLERERESLQEAISHLSEEQNKLRRTQVSMQNDRVEFEQKMQAQVQKSFHEITTQIENMARRIQTSNEETFATNYSRQGIAYTIKPGDSLFKIAKEQHSTIEDIRNANKLSDPSKLQVGQVIFVPQREK